MEIAPMHETGTQRVKEKTFYRILGNGKVEVMEYLLKDTFTITLLALVLITNIMIILIPVAMHLLEIWMAKSLCYSLALSLLPGYAALLYLLVARFREKALAANRFTQWDKGQLTLSKAPRLRNMIIGIQCMLFASLLCSTFIMREQMQVLHQSQPGDRLEHVMLRPGAPAPSQLPLLPRLRHLISI
jgi:hypothetical protein